MRPRYLRIGIALVSLIALVGSGCAMGKSRTAGKVGSGDIVEDRQRLMKLNGASWQDVQAKVKAGNIEAVAVNAETMAINAQHIPSLFPAGSLSEKSKAKPEIWQKRAEFEAAAKNLETFSIRLRDSARAKNQAQTEEIVKDFGRNACGTCHTPFRVPPRT